MTNAKNHNSVVDRRYDLVFFFDVQDGNPNGDPDAGNLPRLDPQTLQGFVTDVCTKRKIRNAAAAIGNARPGCDLYFQTQDAVYEKRVLNLVHQTAWDTLGLKPSIKGEGDETDTVTSELPEAAGKKARKGKSTQDRGDFDKVRQARTWMCQQFFDIRAFGAVMTTGVNCGQVRGPVQITFARSIDPIVPMELAITRKSVTTEREATEQINKTDPDTGKRFGTITGTMGRKSTVSYALYRGHGFINPLLAKDTGFTWADMRLFFEAMVRMFDLDRSASRGLMALRKVVVFEHSSPLGNAPAHVLFDHVTVPELGPEKPARNFADYSIVIQRDGLPKGITIYELPEQLDELVAPLS